MFVKIALLLQPLLTQVQLRVYALLDIFILAMGKPFDA
jgi:hypothetical protein